MKNPKYILVTGGEGYIGKSICCFLSNKKMKIVSIDNLSNSKRKNLNNDIIFHKIDLKDKSKLKKIFKNYNFETIVHLAAKTDARESNIKKKKYYLNNFIYAKKLLEIAQKNNTKNFIYASSAAVYGSYKNSFEESDKKKPINYYGKYKLKFENHLSQSKMKYANLRFFNICGADTNLKIGQRNNNGVVKKLCNAAYKNKYFYIYGNNFLTKDGYCIRDYLHIKDLNNILYKTLIYLRNKKKNITINCGTGKGTSVRDLIKNYPNKKLKIKIRKKINGDPPEVISNIYLLKKKLGYVPIYSSLKNILKSSIDWEKYLNSN